MRSPSTADLNSLVVRGFSALVFSIIPGTTVPLSAFASRPPGVALAASATSSLRTRRASISPATTLLLHPLSAVSSFNRARAPSGVVGAGGGDDRELVAAETRHHVVVTQAAAQPLGDHADQLVADRVAERVVDVLEVIEIDIEDRRRRRPFMDLFDRRLA